MDLPSISDINSMKRDDLRGVLIDIIKKRNNADTPGDSFKNTLHAILCEIKACNEETKALKEEIATLKLSNGALCKELSELKCVSNSAPTSASEDSTSSVKLADVVKQSVRSVFYDDKSKNEIIMSKVKEGENDQQYVTNVCKIIHFEGQPTDVVRLGRKKDGHPRPLRVTFSCPFDARVFLARFVGHRKADENADDTIGVHVRESRIERLVICGKLNKYTEDHHENHQRPGTPPNELNCLYLNARSVKSETNERNKPVELQHILSTFEVHLVAITETWLTEDLLYSGILPQNMQCHRKDRSETRQSVRGGGLLLGIDNRLP
ncbi:hypothetical protein CAPTEDRAFT_194159 [Capitella teleta]|uniref:Endonuclease/exonuclease/phosphatase domain-containing protein n=1 Tax=Capitella teleta TaxID=283909 RepID=R7T3D9_CAPTE|nr:hypothetical protein CAPTEDRAFT_194159 [Capitella teleta]|eukprot:ELT87143.1 hypothetical protein CAPTEDRAFT_194159 [Capitella teleta]